MKVFAIIASLLLALTAQAQLKKSAAPISFASSTTHEAELTVGRISLVSEENLAGDRESVITIYGAYNRDWQNNMQWGFEGGLVPYPDTGGDTKSLFAAMGTVTYNLDSNYRNSFFGIGGVGMYPAFDDDDNEYDSAFTFFAGFGKRIEMWGKINYKPYLRIWKKGDEDMSFEIQALNFSIFY